MEDNYNRNIISAVILAGGEGKRLYPLTKNMPKPLIKINGKPVIKHIIELLYNNGVRNCAVTVRYLGDMIIDCLGSEYFGVDLNYYTETEPLGTAGSVKAVGEQSKTSDNFIIISGDAYCDFDLMKAVDFHKSKKALATLILKRVNNPLDYGIVLTDDEGRITGFIEKPTWSHAYSDKVNTGVYIVNKDILNYIPEGTFYDFGRDLFPRLCSEEARIFGYEDGGKWWDIGDIEMLLDCNLNISGKSIIESGAEIGRNVTIYNSIIYSGAVIGNGSYIDTSLICEDAVIPKKTILPKYSVVTAENVIRFKKDRTENFDVACALVNCSENLCVGVSGKRRNNILEKIADYGGTAYDLGNQCNCAGYGSWKLGLDLSYDSENDRIYDRNGLPVNRITEQKIGTSGHEKPSNSKNGRIVDKIYISDQYLKKFKKTIDWNMIAYLIIYNDLRSAALPYYCPDSLSDYLKSKGISIEYYSLFPYDKGEESIRKKAAKYEWLVFPETAAYHYNKIKNNNNNELPDIYQKSSVISRESGTPLIIMQKLGVPSGEGVTVKYNNGSCKVLPDNRSYYLFAEAHDSEAAEEIIGLTEQEIRKLEKYSR